MKPATGVRNPVARTLPRITDLLNLFWRRENMKKFLIAGSSLAAVGAAGAAGAVDVTLGGSIDMVPRGFIPAAGVMRCPRASH